MVYNPMYSESAENPKQLGEAKSEFSHELASLREKSGFSLRKAAEEIKVSKATLHNWEQGKFIPNDYGHVVELLSLYWGAAKGKALSFIEMRAHQCSMAEVQMMSSIFSTESYEEEERFLRERFERLGGVVDDDALAKLEDTLYYMRG